MPVAAAGDAEFANLILDHILTHPFGDTYADYALLSEAHMLPGWGRAAALVGTGSGAASKRTSTIHRGSLDHQYVETLGRIGGLKLTVKLDGVYRAYDVKALPALAGPGTRSTIVRRRALEPWLILHVGEGTYRTE